MGSMLKPNGLFMMSKKDIVPVELVDDEDYDSEDYYNLADEDELMDEDLDDNNNEDEDEDEYDASEIVEVKRGDSEFWAARGKKDSDFWATRGKRADDPEDSFWAARGKREDEEVDEAVVEAQESLQ